MQAALYTCNCSHQEKAEVQGKMEAPCVHEFLISGSHQESTSRDITKETSAPVNTTVTVAQQSQMTTLFIVHMLTVTTCLLFQLSR